MTCSCPYEALRFDARLNNGDVSHIGARVPFGLVVVTTLTLPHWVRVDYESMTFESYLLSAFPTSIIAGSTVLVCLWVLVVGLASVMLIHRVIWPMASRVLYDLSRYHILQHKKALNTVSVALLGIAVTGGYGWQSIMKLLA
jgi:hypothetical protein